MKKISLLPVLILAFFLTRAEKYEITSPDGNLSAEIVVGNDIFVTLKQKNTTVLELGNLMLRTQTEEQDQKDYKVTKVKRHSVDEVIHPVIREKTKSIPVVYEELILNARNHPALAFRMFNDGLAYRFITSEKDSLTIYAESLDLFLQENDSARFQASTTFNSSYETPYEHKRIPDIQNDQLCHLPFLIEKPNGPIVMVTESDLYDYPGLWLKGTGEAQLSATNPPFPKKLSYSGNIYSHGQIKETYPYIAKVKGNRTFPWRIFAVTGQEADLINNNMVFALASPRDEMDFSWVKPGVVMFDWWAKNNIYGVDFKAGINTETAKYFIDFCARQGFRYFLFDDGWCPKDDLLNEIDGLDMEEVTAYAESKGVDVMLWVIWHALERQWDEAFDQFEEWGIKGIKMDFMNRDDQPMVAFFEAIAEKAAEKKMVVNYHGAYKPCGLRRKYPNVLTREALIEFEYNGWTHHDNPEHHNLLPYIRMFTGPMDYIPATMRNSTKDNFFPVPDYPMGQGTRAHAMALFVILNSPMTMLPDSPSDYYREQECTDFLAKIPLEWDETKLLDGKIGKYTVLARRAAEEWFIGAITNEAERTFNLETSFLKPGNYKIVAIEDGINADDRAEDYKRVEKNITAGERITLKLAPGGGWVARIIPQ